MEWCFGPDGDVELGIKLAAAAAPVFLAMSLFTECHRWSERAILALDEAARSGQEEMQLQGALGMSLSFMRGGGDTTRMALSRSLEIAEERRDVPTQMGLLGAQSLLHLREADFKTALQYAKRTKALAGIIEAPAVIAFAHSVLGGVLHFMGTLAGARTEIEASLHHWSRLQRHSTPQMDHPESLAVILACTVYPEIYASLALARTLWLQGHPAQAVERANQVIKAAERIDHPMSRVTVLPWSAWIFLCTGDFDSAERHIDSGIVLAESYSLTHYATLGRGLRATLAICRGDAKAGVEILRACLEALHSRYKLPITLLTSRSLKGS